MAPFLTGLGPRQLPLDRRLGRMARRLPGGDFPTHEGRGGQPAIPTLTLDARTRQLGHVQPAGVCGRITQVQRPHTPPGRGRWTRRIEGRGRMGMAVVQHHTAPLRVGERRIDPGLHPGRAVLGGAPRRDLDMAPAGQRWEAHAHMTGPLAPILVVIPRRPPWCQRPRLARLADPWVGRFIAADHRREGIIGLGRPLQEIFHAPDTGGSEGGPTPRLPWPGLQRGLLRVRRPVSSALAATTRRAPRWCASHGRVQH
jgi:hypothetical protein